MKKEEASEHATELSRLGAAKGGLARAEALSPQERRESARYAAEVRWANKLGLPKETHAGVLTIAERQLPCSVLDNGLRVFSSMGLSRAIGSRKKGRTSASQDTSPQLPPFLASPAIKQFIPGDLMAPLISPVRYKMLSGGYALGYEATLLPRICGVILDAQKAGAIGERQRQVIDTAEILLRGFANVGIIALVDEATGYQAERARDELNKILEAYIAKELLPWTRRFPDEFFRQIYRLQGWEFKPGTVKGPLYVGKLVNKLVYEPLPPGVLDELKRVNPRTEKGYRRYKHHQFLTEDIGHPHLNKQIIEVTALMRVSEDKRGFQALFQKAFPKRGQQLPLDLPIQEKNTPES